MFEKILEGISGKLGPEKREFFIISHKRYRREIYFRNTRNAVSFMKVRFNSLKKGFIFFLIKIGILQPFLKKIILSSKLGDVIFVASQIKSFDLEKKIVYSFIKNDSEKEDFLESKEYQMKMGKKGFAPEIIKFDRKMPFCEEELLKQYNGNYYAEFFEKLYSYYKNMGITRTSIKGYVKLLKKQMKDNNFMDEKISDLLKKLSSEKGNLLMTEIHGDFSKEQVLVKEDSYVFIDWNPEKRLILGDWIHFFNTSEILDKIPFERNKKALELLKIYPKEVRKNFILYIILDSISSIINNESDQEIFFSRLNRLTKIFFKHFSL